MLSAFSNNIFPLNFPATKHYVLLNRMKKLIVINDKETDSITCRIAKKYLIFEGVYLQNGASVKYFIEEEKPYLLFVDLEEELEGDDIRTALSQLNAGKRLRIHVFRLNFFKVLLFKFMPIGLLDSILEESVEGKTAR